MHSFQKFNIKVCLAYAWFSKTIHEIIAYINLFFSKNFFKNFIAYKLFQSQFF